jgi:peptide deformylase
VALLHIIEAPDPVLAKKARAVTDEEFGRELVKLLSDMGETMYAAPGVGLAAPQVGDSRRILVADPGFEEEEEEERCLYCMVNPEIVAKSKDFINHEESCLSVPEFTIMVKRYAQVTVRWRDGEGTTHSKGFEGFGSVVIQHEMDHLEGITLLNRASRLKRSRYIQKVKKARASEGMLL